MITGASSGIGRATAERLARPGARLVLAARGEPGLREVERVCAARGASVLVVPTDVTDAAAVARLVDAAVVRFGGIDAFVGAAAVWSYGRFEQTPPDVVRQVIETTLLGQLTCTRAVLPALRARHGTLVLVASMYGRLASPLVSPYVAAKWGLVGFAESLRQEMHGSGVDVVTVLPAAVDTPIYRHAANYTGRPLRPLPLMVGPDRVARAVVRSLRRPRRQVLVGRAHRVGVLLHDVAPGLYDHLARAAVPRLVLRRGDVPAHEGTVHRAQPVGEPAADGWRARDRRTVARGAATVAGVAALVAAARRRSAVR